MSIGNYRHNNPSFAFDRSIDSSSLTMGAAVARRWDTSFHRHIAKISEQVLRQRCNVSRDRSGEPFHGLVVADHPPTKRIYIFVWGFYGPILK